MCLRWEKGLVEDIYPVVLPKEDQMRFAGQVNNTVGSRLQTYTGFEPRGVPNRDTRYLALLWDYYGIRTSYASSAGVPEKPEQERHE
jgi:hypothetical protein